jgi:hypothetical protein
MSVWLTRVGKEEVIVKVLLDGHALDVQCFLFKMTMVVNSEAVMKEESFVNPIIQLWTKINSSSILKCKLSKFIKLAEIACVQVLRFVENEHCFLVVAIMKNKLRNCLTCH